jgi:signal transduction histidine kinase
MHGGVIELESTLGQGSRFTFKLKPAVGVTP